MPSWPTSSGPHAAIGRSGFHTSDDLLKLNDEPTITVGQPVSTIPSIHGRWILVVDDKRRTDRLGRHRELCAAIRVQDSDVNLSATSASRGDPLRDLLNSALSSPSGRCVVTDESGTLIGTASDHDVIGGDPAGEGSEDGGMNWISSNIDRIVVADDQPRLAHAGADDPRSHHCAAARLVGASIQARAGRDRRNRGSALHDSSLALFIILPVILGTKILDPIEHLLSR